MVIASQLCGLLQYVDSQLDWLHGPSTTWMLHACQAMLMCHTRELQQPCWQAQHTHVHQDVQVCAIGHGVVQSPLRPGIAVLAACLKAHAGVVGGSCGWAIAGEGRQQPKGVSWARPAQLMRPRHGALLHHSLLHAQVHSVQP